MSSAKSSSSSASNSISSLNAAAARWSLSSTDLPLWRARMVASQSTPAPAPVAQQSHVPKGADPKSRQQFLDELKLKQMAAEERLARLRSGEADDDDDEEEEEQAAAAAEERGDQKHAEEDDAEEDGEEDSSEDEEEEAEDEAEYENELEYYVHELLCVDAINHDPPSQLHAHRWHSAASSAPRDSFAAARYADSHTVALSLSLSLPSDSDSDCHSGQRGEMSLLCRRQEIVSLRAELDSMAAAVLRSVECAYVRSLALRTLLCPRVQ